MSLKPHFKKITSNDNGPRLFMALEGGAVHGAFAAGALEVLEEKRLLDNVVAVSGTSAGANNAVALVAGLEQKKRGGAKRVLTRLWDGIGKKGDSLKPIKDAYRMFSGARWPNLPPKFRTDSELANKYSSLKSQSGHVRDHIADVIKDWDVIRNSKIKTFIGASRLDKDENRNNILVEENFTGQDIDADAVAASGCLFGTHKKNGNQYVDGAFTKNPPMSGILNDDEYDDLFAIMLSPEPETVQARHQDQITAVDADGLLGSETYDHLAHEVKRGRRVHVIALDLKKVRQLLVNAGISVPEEIDESSKMNFDSTWVNVLREAGKAAAMEWVLKHEKDLGVRSSYQPVIRPSVDLHNVPEVA